jgi:hypothetical protein
VLRWLPPIAVNIDGAELPTVITPVKKDNSSSVKCQVNNLNLERAAVMINYSNDELAALVEYIKAFDKCANEPDETYGASFIKMEAERKRLKKFFTSQEFDAIIINMDEIKAALRGARLIP